MADDSSKETNSHEEGKHFNYTDHGDKNQDLSPQDHIDQTHDPDIPYDNITKLANEPREIVCEDDDD